ncbi:E3 ubiquitin ligase PQT3-like isoform X2 [Asparagus officinalis]|uniref:E3 ubiquitin ligase PQT3-like isoform X2 n=1 Tax=Asparagus officinalis TaxID=4686 RepID=UPI00098E020B|nr:E3 ubiquitin ligase PQT3-like isoform X2 [Asparagus officinalis]
MSIRFKFRSSVAFDSVDLDGRRSISLGELRAKIIAQKKLQLCKDFDLLISDAESGAAFENEGIQIKEGSSVVIKRVPAGLSSLCDLNVGNVSKKDAKDAGYVGNVTKKDLKDAGYVERVATMRAEGSLPESDAAFGYMDITANKKDKIATGFSDTPVARFQNVERSDLSEEGIGDNCCKEPATVEIQKQIMKEKEPQKFDEFAGMASPMMFDMDLPTELRCSLCNAIFKDAVMIPCCQHSFCEKCIRMALLRDGRCPKCSSMKCTVNTLLPNLSLRQAIEHFLEAQAVNNALENKIPRDVPDVESGIHVREVSCAMSVRKKEKAYSHSPSANPLSLKMKHMKGDVSSSGAASNHMAGFHGVHNSSKPLQNFPLDEVNLAGQRTNGHGVTVIDGSGTFMSSNRHRKGDRNCYNCGSPDHLIRDCPAASNSYPFNQTGDPAFGGGMPMYGQAYWHGNTFPQGRPYANAYSTQGMMPFDPTMGPISPFGIPLYMSSMYTGMAGPYGFMRMGGGQAPMMSGAERPLTRQEFLEPHDRKQKDKSLHGHPGREQDSDRMPEDYYYKGSQKRKEAAGSFIDDDSPRIYKKQQDNLHYGSSHRQAVIPSDDELPSIELRHERGSHQSISGRDRRARHPEKSNSDSSNRHSRDRGRHHHGISLEKQSERREQHKTDKDVAGHKKHSHRHHEHSVSSEQRRHKEKEASHNSRPSKQIPRSKDDRSDYERWEIIEGADDEYKGATYHKRHRAR